MSQLASDACKGRAVVNLVKNEMSEIKGDCDQDEK